MQQCERRTIQRNWNVYCVVVVMVVVYVVHTHARTHIYVYTHTHHINKKYVKLITHTLYNFAFFYDCASARECVFASAAIVLYWACVQTQIAHAYLIK